MEAEAEESEWADEVQAEAARV
eukprot:COSAG06_NODE_13418_length_1259_cov_1.319828_2_plen_21_part_01